jgi:hypothetical protein
MQIESDHCQRIQEAASMGLLDLTQDDYSYYMNLLYKNTGSKECIKELRNWFLMRSHSAVAISFLLLEYMKNLNINHISNFQENQGLGLFKPMLHTVYAINDIMFNSSLARTEGPYTR